MKEEYSDLINLLEENREAMDYFKSLPAEVKGQVSKSRDKIHSFASLQEIAKSFLKSNT